MSIATPQLERLCALAQIALDGDDLVRATADLERIIDMVDAMNAIDTVNVAPLAHPLDAVQRLREDAVAEQVDRERYQRIAPAAQDGYYLVPRVIE
jgi:aspartyl-tRNA(Asn)/glutamyl-tRNA(Gln) amidotransferase subunit C